MRKLRFIQQVEQKHIRQLSQQCQAVKDAPPGKPDAKGGQPVDTIIALEINKAKAILKLVDESTGAIGRV